MCFKLSVSNIAWSNEDDTRMYQFMGECGYSALEIAPTRIFPQSPYDNTEQAARWADQLIHEYGLAISSIQSIWFGRQEQIFGTKEERESLLEYTKKAIDFASVIKCRNLVFGCPRNRIMPDGADPEIGIRFFRKIGEYATAHGTAIGMEANPPIYQTNYITCTEDALRLIEAVDSNGFLLNLDVGTMLENHEPVELLEGKVKRINHIHISEPGLKRIKHHDVHQELKKMLQQENYQGYISIEMNDTNNLQDIKNVMLYVSRIFEIS